MTGPAPAVDPDSLARFFASHAIDEFAVVPSSAIAAPPGRRPADLYPQAKTMIIFGKVMGDELFAGSVAETAPRTSAFKQDLARVARELAGMLEGAGINAFAVTSVTVQDGKLKGGLSLKHCARDAGLGGIGDNGLLLSPKFGIRLGLGAVLADREIPAVIPDYDCSNLCTHCGLCVRACPAGAIRDGGIDSFRCLNIAGALPGPFVSVFERLMGLPALEPVLSRVANRVAVRSKARCSECLIACPLYKKSGKTSAGTGSRHPLSPGREVHGKPAGPAQDNR